MPSALCPLLSALCTPFLFSLFSFLLFPLSTSALAQSNICAAAGGSRGTNFFTSDGTFGTLSGTPSTNPPTLGPALSGSTTTYLYVDYVTRTSPYPGSPEDGEYNITNSTAYRTDGAWHVITDHGGTNSSSSSGNANGQMMMINASFSPGVFYQQTLTITPNTNFEYSIWLINVIANGSPILPNIELEIDRATVDDDNDGITDEAGEAQVVLLTGDVPNSSTPIWRNYGGIINSGASTQVTVRFRNNAPGGGGNDLAIDDINFTTCNGLPTGNVNGKLYWDANNNGSFDGTDTGLAANIGVELVNPVSGLIVATSQTNTSGDYSFINVPAGTYTIRVQSSDPTLNGATPRTPSPSQYTGVSVTVGGTVNNQNFGYLIPSIAPSKTASVSSTSPGGVYTYTISIPNTGNANATGATFTDALPTGVSYVANSATLNGSSLGAASYPFATARAINTPGEASGQMNAGETATLTFQVTVNASPPSSISNQATVAYVGGPPGSVLTDDPAVSGTANPTVTPVNLPSISASKSASVSSTTPGSTYTYTISISNSGTGAANNSTFTDALPSGVSYVANSATLNGSSLGAASYPFATARAINTPGESSGVLNPGETATIAFQVTVNTSPPSSISNQGSVNYTGGSAVLTDDPAVAGSADPTVTPVNLPNLVAQKTASVSSTTPGSSYTYTITIANSGSANATGATFTDALPAGLTYVVGSATLNGSNLGAASYPFGSAYSINTPSEPAGQLNIGETATLTFDVTVNNSGTLPSNPISNQGTIAHTAGTVLTDDPAVAGSANPTQTPVTFANLSVVKSHAGNFNFNSSDTYTIVVSNAVGAATTSGTVSVTDTLIGATGISITAISGTGWTCVLATASCTRSDALAGGSSYPAITVTVAINTAPSTTFINRAVVSGGGESSTTLANNTANDNTTVMLPDLSVVKEHAGDFPKGVSPAGVYTIVVSNAVGAATTTGTVTVTDTDDSSRVSIASMSGTGWTCVLATATCTRSDALVGGSSYPPILVTVNITSGGSSSYTFNNTAAVSGGGDPTDSNFTDPTNVFTPDNTVDLSVIKSDGAGVTTAIPGQSVSYTITVANSATSAYTTALPSISLVDVVPPILSSVTYTPSVGSYNSGTGVWSGLSLARGASITMTVAGTINPAARGDLINTVEVAPLANGSTDLRDSNLNNNTATDTDSLTPRVNLTISKTDGQTSDVPGTSISYTIQITNSGPSTLLGGTVSDVVDTTRLSGITWTCVAVGGANCTASGTGNISDGVDLPPTTTAPTARITYTLNATILASATGTLSNTVSVAMPAGTTNTGATNVTDNTTLTPESDVQMVSKTVDDDTPLQGSNVVFTLTVRNNGVSDASGVEVSDVLPAGLSFVSSSSVSYSSATGIWSVGTLTVGSTATLQITATATAAGSIINTASKTAQSGTDTNTTNNSASVTITVTAVGVSVSGRVYHDLQPNTAPEPGEDWATGTTVRVNLVQSGSVVQSVQVNAGTGDYSFGSVGAGNYTIVVTNSASSTTATAPSGWLFINPNGSLNVNVSSSNVFGQDFGLYHGSRFSGTVFYDDGQGGGTANNAVQNGGEPGIANITLTASDGSNSVATTTNSLGSYTLYVPYTFGASVTLSHPQSPATGSNIQGASINLATSYGNATAQARSLSFASGQYFDGYNFGVVRPSAWRPSRSGQVTSPGAITYSHLYQPGTLGTANFSQSGGDFTYEVRVDANCNGIFDAGETFQASPNITVDALWPRELDGSLRLCAVEVRVTVVASEPAGTVDIAQIQANLTWANNASVINARTLTDATTVVAASTLQLSKEVRNVTQGTGFASSNQARPGDVLEYRILYQNIGTQPLFEVELMDPVPFYSDLELNAYPSNTEVQLQCPSGSVVNLETGATANILLNLIAHCTLSTAPHPGGTGAAEALLPGEGGYFLYRVRVR